MGKQISLFSLTGHRLKQVYYNGKDQSIGKLLKILRKIFSKFSARYFGNRGLEEGKHKTYN